METVTFKVDTAFARAMNKAMKPLYSTKTEFIRAAIREKIEREEQKAVALREAARGFGTASRKTSDAELRRIRIDAGKEYARKHGVSLE